MKVSSKWRAASLVAGALVIGSVLGPPLARAAAAGLVRIEGGHSSNVAAVSKSGRLSVNTGLATTTAGQLKVSAASPADVVVVYGHTGPVCASGGIYTVPRGKALIITGADFYAEALNTSSFHLLALDIGPAAAPCNKTVAAIFATDPQISQSQVFNPGIPVPAGDAVELSANNDNGTADLYGYLVPAAAVPASALKNLGAGILGGLSTATPPR